MVVKKNPHDLSSSTEKFKAGELKDLVLTALGLSILIGGIIVTPNFPIVMGAIMKILEKKDHRPIPKRKVRRVLENLEKSELIFLQKKHDTVYVRINEQKSELVKKYSIRELLRLKEKKIDRPKEWGLIMFDVPEIQRNKRNYLREFLLWLGFYPYQKSVYAFPGDCEAEVAFLKEIVASGKYIRYILAKKIDNEDALIRYFKARKKIS